MVRGDKPILGLGEKLDALPQPLFSQVLSLGVFEWEHGYEHSHSGPSLSNRASSAGRIARRDSVLFFKFLCCSYLHKLCVTYHANILSRWNRPVKWPFQYFKHLATNVSSGGVVQSYIENITYNLGLGCGIGVWLVAIGNSSKKGGKKTNKKTTTG